MFAIYKRCYLNSQKACRGGQAGAAKLEACKDKSIYIASLPQIGAPRWKGSNGNGRAGKGLPGLTYRFFRFRPTFLD